jgi:hypothetical protein
MMMVWIMYDDEMNKKGSERRERDRWLRDASKE